MDEKERLGQLEARVAQLESEVTRLREAVQAQEKDGGQGAPLQPPFLPEGSAARGQTTEGPGAVPGQEVAPAGLELEEKDFLPPKEPVDWEQVIGRVWLPRIFLFVLLLGVLWGFTAAVREGLLTEPVRVGLGVLVTAALGFFGERQMRAERHALGQVLLGGAVSVGVLTVFAAHMLYGMIPSAVSFAIDVLLTAGGVFLAWRHRSEALGILATVGGYLVPFLVRSEAPNTLFLVGYETLVSVAFLVFALRMRYQVLYYTSLALYHVTLMVYSQVADVIPEELALCAYGALGQHAVLLAVMLRSKVPTVQQLGTLFGSFALAVMWVFSWLPDAELEIVLLSTSVLYGALAVWRRAEREQVLPALLSVGFFSLMLYILQVFDGLNMALPLLVEGAVTLWLALRLRSLLQVITGSVIFFLGTVVTLWYVIDEVLSLETLSWLVLLGILILLYRAAVQGALARVILGTATVLSLVFLTEITLVLTKNWDGDHQQMAISFVWAGYAILGIVYGILRNSRVSRVVGVVLLFLTLLKLIFVDLPSVSIVVRAILFIGIGGIGVAVSRLFYSRKGASE